MSDMGNSNKEATLSENAYYLTSILRYLREVQSALDETGRLGLGDMVLEDNINWLDCYIDNLPPKPT